MCSQHWFRDFVFFNSHASGEMVQYQHQITFLSRTTDCPGSARDFCCSSSLGTRGFQFLAPCRAVQRAVIHDHRGLFRKTGPLILSPGYSDPTHELPGKLRLPSLQVEPSGIIRVQTSFSLILEADYLGMRNVRTCSSSETPHKAHKVHIRQVPQELKT